MKSLYILRHAKAAAADDPAADRDRPLTEAGRRTAHALAGRFGKDADVPALVLCSSALRARETLDAIVSGWPRQPDILFEPGLYLASAAALLRRLRRLPEEARSVLLVGHNPGLQELALDLAGDDEGARASLARFSTAALAIFTVSTRWRDLRRAALRSAVSPSDLELPGED